MITTDSTAGSDRQCEPILRTYRRLRRSGFSDGEAANLAGHMNRIAICAQPWAVGELTHLLFLREMSRGGRSWSDADDRASTDTGDGWRTPERTGRSTDSSDSPISSQFMIRAVLDLKHGRAEHRASAPSEQGREGR